MLATWRHTTESVQQLWTVTKGRVTVMGFTPHCPTLKLFVLCIHPDLLVQAF